MRGSRSTALWTIMSGAGLGVAVAMAASVHGWAQVLRIGEAPAVANQVTVDLVRQDQSDCTNSNVKAGDPEKDLGTVTVTRDGETTAVLVAITASPRTKYQFFLKCVRQLGDVTTGDEGTGGAAFSFPTSAVGNSYGFDMYPDGAPAGDKFQSVTVTFR